MCNSVLIYFLYFRLLNKKTVYYTLIYYGTNVYLYREKYSHLQILAFYYLATTTNSKASLTSKIEKQNK